MKIIQLLFVVFLVNLPSGEACTPNQGFYAVTNQPTRRRNSGDFFMYAIDTGEIASKEAIEFTKTEPELSSNVIETGEIRTYATDLWGCYLRVRQPTRYKGSRFGAYTFTHTPSGKSVNTYVRPESKFLDTGGVFTVTVYPKEVGSSELAESVDNTIGVRWTPGCRNFVWCQGKRRNINTGPRLTVKSTSDAGIYTIQRRGRGKRGWFVQIEVIVASCPLGQYWTGTSCTTRSANPTCFNGGVPKDASDSCTCPPYFTGPDCTTPVFNLAPGVGTSFLLGFGPTDLFCRDLIGGNNKCRGHLFCSGDLFGCKCFPGWRGNNCDKRCPDGKWGIACSQFCPSDNKDCNRFDGTDNPEKALLTVLGNIVV